MSAVDFTPGWILQECNLCSFLPARVFYLFVYLFLNQELCCSCCPGNDDYDNDLWFLPLLPQHTLTALTGVPGQLRGGGPHRQHVQPDGGGQVRQQLHPEELPIAAGHR